MKHRSTHHPHAPEAYEPRIFDGPAVVMPDRVKEAAGLAPDDYLGLIDMTRVKVIVAVTDDETAHVGGSASVEEKIALLHQVIEGLESLQ
jgi:hypothetical protein